MTHHLKERIEYNQDEAAWLAKGAPEGEEPWRGWDSRPEQAPLLSIEWHRLECKPHWYPSAKYRRRPKLINAIDAKGVRHEWPEPMREAPEIGTRYCLVDVPGNTITWCVWNSDTFDYRWLDAGLCQPTEEGAQMQLKALRAVCRGG